MYAILVSAFSWVLNWFLRGVVIKFIILTALFYVVEWIGSAVLSQIDISPLTGMQTLLDSLPTGVLWFMALFRFDVGLPLVLGAMLSKFIIRRLPIIG